MLQYSDYIVFVDESGDHGLSFVDPYFPVFALSFCVVPKANYIAKVVPSVQNLKFKYWGHDAVVLHEHEIRKRKGDFAFLMADRTKRKEFFADLHQIMVDAPITLIGSVIDKEVLVAQSSSPRNPYEIALQLCLTRLHRFLQDSEQQGRRVHLVFERRGKTEDDELELAFRRIVTGSSHCGPGFKNMEFEPVFAGKSVNSTGLQIADLTARPMALRVLRPDQPNRTYEVIQTKLVEIAVFPEGEKQKGPG